MEKLSDQQYSLEEYEIDNDTFNSISRWLIKAHEAIEKFNDPVYLTMINHHHLMILKIK